MISLNGREVKVEHFPDGTQRINLMLNDMFTDVDKITWKFEKEEELSTLIYVTKHLKNFPEAYIIYHISPTHAWIAFVVRKKCLL